MIKNIYLVIAALSIISCSTEDITDSRQTAATQILTVAVTDNGFANSDGTRAEENGYTTTFTSGDKIGVFAVKDGEVSTLCNNLPLTYDGSTWSASTDAPLYNIPNATYYAYYPYTDGTTIDASATDVFTTLVSNWQVKSDQSTYANYTASDLMVSSATTVSGGSISFSMAHKMGLVVIDMPKVSYTVDNEIVSVPASVSWKSPTSFAPYIIDATNGIARYITNSAQVISGTYNNGNYLFSFTTTMTSGQYNKYTIDKDNAITGTVVDLSSTTPTDPIADNTLITGTVENGSITIAAGAKVFLYNASITSSSASAIKCNGDATIILYGTNIAKTTVAKNSGIEAGSKGTTLTIDGNGSIVATGASDGAGIGCGRESSCGNIIIKSGTVTATAGTYGAGIGSGYVSSSCGNITISGGTITATGGDGGAGIGSGCYKSTCDDITISGGTILATGGRYSAGIGSGCSGSTCKNIKITSDVTKVTVSKGENADYIGAGNYNGTCGTIDIADGAKQKIFKEDGTTLLYTE